MNRRLALIVGLIALVVIALVVVVNQRETPVVPRATQPQGTVLLIPGYGGRGGESPAVGGAVGAGWYPHPDSPYREW